MKEGRVKEVCEGGGVNLRASLRLVLALALALALILQSVRQRRGRLVVVLRGGGSLPALAAQRRPGTAVAAPGAAPPLPKGEGAAAHHKGEGRGAYDPDALEHQRKVLAARVLRQGSKGRSRLSMSYVDRRVHGVSVALRPWGFACVSLPN